LMEPDPYFVALVGNPESEVGWTVLAAAGFVGGFVAKVRLDDGTVHNAIKMHPMNAALTPQRPVRLRLTRKGAAKIDFRGLMHEVAEDKWKGVPPKP
jgi:hypothetical protein